MATKAELEAELATLKKQLAESAARRQVEDMPAEDETEPDGIIPGFDLSEVSVKEIASEIETLARDKPIVMLLAVFLVGYVVGRVR